MAMSITDHIETYYKLSSVMFQLLIRGFAMLASVLLKETHPIYRMDDLTKIILYSYKSKFVVDPTPQKCIKR
jgi:hypothetical protein